MNNTNGSANLNTANSWSQKNPYLSPQNLKPDKKRTSSSFSYQNSHLDGYDEERLDDYEFKTAQSDNKRYKYSTTKS